MPEKTSNAKLIIPVSIILLIFMIILNVTMSLTFTTYNNIPPEKMVFYSNTLLFEAVITVILGLAVTLIFFSVFRSALAANSPDNDFLAKTRQKIRNRFNSITGASSVNEIPVESKIEADIREPSAASSTCFKGKRILLADDVDINREVLIELLEPASVEIDWAENGREAVKMYCENCEYYDLIFMDTQMPGMDGYEAARRIRDYESRLNSEYCAWRIIYNNVPIVALSSNVFKDDVDKSIEAGMNAHIGKPLDYNELLGVMRKFLT